MSESMYQVRILRDGELQATAYVHGLMAAHDWAFTNMRRLHKEDRVPTKMWGGIVCSGRLFVDEQGLAKDLFWADEKVREGLVLDKRMFQDPEVDLHHLFGLRRKG